MNLFKHNPSAKKITENQAAMAEMALKVIHDGVIITDKKGVIKFINPAAATMTGYGLPDRALGLDYGLVLKMQSKEGRELPDSENPLIQAMQTGQTLDVFQCNIVIGQSAKTIPVAICMIPADGLNQDRIISFRDITKELEEEGEQTEFISTASHEMRTPVATIDGYLSLSLNPQTATIDERARNYLVAAQKASKHLGKLFRDLLDVTKLDDGRIRAHFEPVEMVGLVEEIVNEFVARAKEGKIDLKFGSAGPQSFGGESRRLGQVVYSFVDVDFMREILENLIDNAIKYTPNGGSIYVNVRGDGDRVLINVTDTGMGISSDDLAHIFQKFYRADNSDTRTIGGTGLGLYLVKQRAEAMGGKVWAESAFGEGSTFYVSLPRLTHAEYEKRMIIVRNQQAQEQMQAKAQTSTDPQLPAGLTPTPKDFMHEKSPIAPEVSTSSDISGSQPPSSGVLQAPAASMPAPTETPNSQTSVAPSLPTNPSQPVATTSAPESLAATTQPNPPMSQPVASAPQLSTAPIPQSIVPAPQPIATTPKSPVSSTPQAAVPLPASSADAATLPPSIPRIAASPSSFASRDNTLSLSMPQTPASPVSQIPASSGSRASISAEPRPSTASTPQTPTSPEPQLSTTSSPQPPTPLDPQLSAPPISPSPTSFTLPVPEPNQPPTIDLPLAPPIPPIPPAPPVLKSDETIAQKQIDINLNGESK